MRNVTLVDVHPRRSLRVMSGSLKAFFYLFFFLLVVVKDFAPVGSSPMIAWLCLHGGGPVLVLDLSVWVKEWQLLFFKELGWRQRASQLL